MTTPSLDHLLEYRLTDLKRFAKYGIVIEAYNAIGVGPRSPETSATTLEDGKTLSMSISCKKIARDSHNLCHFQHV